MSFPFDLFTPRTKENKDGISFDSAKTKVLFADDIVFLDDEVVGLENEFLKNFLAGALNVRVVGSNLSIGSNNLYTCPSGKKAFIIPKFQLFNTSAGNITATFFVDLSGTTYNFYTSSVLATGLGSFVSLNTGLVLEAGDTVGVEVATSNGLNAFFAVIEFSDIVPLSTKFITPATSGDHLLYEVFPGKSARLFSNLDNSAYIGIYNGSVSPDQFYSYSVPFGATPSSLYQRDSSFNINSLDLDYIPFFDTLTEDDMIYINVALGSSDIFVWCNVFEY